MGEFSKDRRKKDGYDARCKECNRARSRAYRKANPEKMRAYARAYREANREKTRESTRAWRKANPKKARESVRAWHKTNLEKVRAIEARYRAHKAKAPQGDPLKLQQRLTAIYASPCAQCGATENIHADHIHPLSKGGHHAAYNLMPLCGSCNSAKHNKLQLLLPKHTASLLG